MNIITENFLFSHQILISNSIPCIKYRILLNHKIAKNETNISNACIIRSLLWLCYKYSISIYSFTIVFEFKRLCNVIVFVYAIYWHLACYVIAIIKKKKDGISNHVMIHYYGKNDFICDAKLLFNWCHEIIMWGACNCRVKYENKIIWNRSRKYIVSYMLLLC